MGDGLNKTGTTLQTKRIIRRIIIPINNRNGILRCLLICLTPFSLYACRYETRKELILLIGVCGNDSLSDSIFILHNAFTKTLLLYFGSFSFPHCLSFTYFKTIKK